MGLEFEDHEVTKSEHEFYRAFVTILEHLKNRALKAEAEVRFLRKELEAKREQVEVNSILNSERPMTAPKENQSDALS